MRSPCWMIVNVMTDDHHDEKENDFIISGHQIIIISFMMMTMMTSNHVHCFHDLLHGKARPRPPSHVHLRKGSLAFTSILEIICFSSPPTFWHSCSICHCIGHFYFHFQTQPLELFSGTKTLSWKLFSTQNFRSVEIPSNICFYFQLLACYANHWVFHVGDFSGHLGIRSWFVLWWKVFTLFLFPQKIFQKSFYTLASEVGLCSGGRILLCLPQKSFKKASRRQSFSSSHFQEKNLACDFCLFYCSYVCYCHHHRPRHHPCHDGSSVVTLVHICWFLSSSWTSSVSSLLSSWSLTLPWWLATLVFVCHCPHHDHHHRHPCPHHDRHHRHPCYHHDPWHCHDGLSLLCLLASCWTRE